MKNVVRGIVLTICLCHPAVDGIAAKPRTAASPDIGSRAFSNPENDGSGPSQPYGLPWANGRFVYAFSPEVEQNPVRVAAFVAACQQLLQNTALSCVPRSQAMSDRDYVVVVDGGRDFSFVGRQGGRQLLSILIWNNPIVIMHEIKHALGWGHEQQHPDRDAYVEVLFANIAPESRENFAVFDNGTEGPYDFDSIMHFSPTDFARPTRTAIRARPFFRKAQIRMGQRDHLSAIDVQEIREFYGDASVRWCGISRKPTALLPPGCRYVCHLEADPSVGAWLPEGDCRIPPVVWAAGH